MIIRLQYKGVINKQSTKAQLCKFIDLPIIQTKNQTVLNTRKFKNVIVIFLHLKLFKFGFFSIFVVVQRCSVFVLYNTTYFL